MEMEILSSERLKALLRLFKERHGAEYGLCKLGYFGSFGHNTATPASDVDIVFDTDSPNLYMTAMMKQDLEELLGRSVDVIQLRRLINPRWKVHHSAFVRFYGLLSEFQLSPQPNEALLVKIEVDTNPPAGAGLETDLVRRHVTLRLQHHDRASLLAGRALVLAFTPDHRVAVRDDGGVGGEGNGLFPALECGNGRDIGK